MWRTILVKYFIKLTLKILNLSLLILNLKRIPQLNKLLWTQGILKFLINQHKKVKEKKYK